MSGHEHNKLAALIINIIIFSFERREGEEKEEGEEKKLGSIIWQKGF